MTTKAPTFTQPLQSVVALEGSAATFEAHISGKVLIHSSKICYWLSLISNVYAKKNDETFHRS